MPSLWLVPFPRPQLASPAVYAFVDRVLALLTPLSAGLQPPPSLSARRLCPSLPSAFLPSSPPRSPLPWASFRCTVGLLSLRPCGTHYLLCAFPRSDFSTIFRFFVLVLFSVTLFFVMGFKPKLSCSLGFLLAGSCRTRLRTSFVTLLVVPSYCLSGLGGSIGDRSLLDLLSVRVARGARLPAPQRPCLTSWRLLTLGVLAFSTGLPTSGTFDFLARSAVHRFDCLFWQLASLSSCFPPSLPSFLLLSRFPLFLPSSYVRSFFISCWVSTLLFFSSSTFCLLSPAFGSVQTFPFLR